MSTLATRSRSAIHALPIGLHADVVVKKEDYGIPGISKVYRARLTNFAILPVEVTVCDFTDDAGYHGTMVATSLEKWDPTTKKWENIFESLSTTHHRLSPYPLGIVEAHLRQRRLWQFQTLFGSEGAIAAYDLLAIGDQLRFVVLPDKQQRIPTVPVTIDEHHSRGNSPYRIAH